VKIIPLTLPGLYLIETKLHSDSRGFFAERYRKDLLDARGIHISFVQDNHSHSKPGVLRGLHYQVNPTQGKMVSAIRGAIFDVAVDIRVSSPTFGRWYGVELTGTNGKSLWIPAGYAHGYCVLGDEPADVFYKVDGPYSAATEGGIRWNDSDVGIQWPIQNPQVSERDIVLPSLSEYSKNPAFK